MKELGKIAKATANALDAPHLKQLRAEREKTIAVKLVQAYEVLNTYGADPDTIKSRQIVFARILEGHNAEQIDSAFDRWFEIGKGLPEPSDILKILNERSVYSGPEYKYFDRTKEENNPRYGELKDEEKALVDEALNAAKEACAKNSPAKKTLKERADCINTEHYERLNDEQQEIMRGEVKKTIERMRILKEEHLAREGIK